MEHISTGGIIGDQFKSFMDLTNFVLMFRLLSIP